MRLLDPSTNQYFHYKFSENSNCSFSSVHGNAEIACVLLLLDLTQPESLHEISNSWIPGIQREHPDAFVLIVGTKSDLRYNTGLGVTVSEAEKFAASHGLLYVEICNQDGKNVDLLMKIMRIRTQHLLRKKPDIGIRTESKNDTLGKKKSSNQEESWDNRKKTYQQLVQEQRKVLEEQQVNRRHLDNVEQRLNFLEPSSSIEEQNQTDTKHQEENRSQRGQQTQPIPNITKESQHNLSQTHQNSLSASKTMQKSKQSKQEEVSGSSSKQYQQQENYYQNIQDSPQINLLANGSSKQSSSNPSPLKENKNQMSQSLKDSSNLASNDTYFSPSQNKTDQNIYKYSNLLQEYNKNKGKSEENQTRNEKYLELKQKYSNFNIEKQRTRGSNIDKQQEVSLRNSSEEKKTDQQSKMQSYTYVDNAKERGNNKLKKQDFNLVVQHLDYSNNEGAGKNTPGFPKFSNNEEQQKADNSEVQDQSGSHVMSFGEDDKSPILAKVQIDLGIHGTASIPIYKSSTPIDLAHQALDSIVPPVQTHLFKQLSNLIQTKISECNSKYMERNKSSKQTRKEQPVIGRIEVDLDGGNKATLVVREGEDVRRLVSHFCKVYNINPESKEELVQAAMSLT